MTVDADWTLRELVAEVAAELARDYQPADNGQIRAVPDERAIRYYAALGLMDAPSKLRGRTALYGARHLAQLVATKRLQSAGKSLDDIKSILPNLDDAALSRISGIVVSKNTRSRARRAAFWKTEPASGDAEAHGKLASTSTSRRRSFDELHAHTSCTVTLAPGVTLSFPANRPLARSEVLSLATSAAPLLEWLSNHALLLEPQADHDPE